MKALPTTFICSVNLWKLYKTILILFVILRKLYLPLLVVLWNRTSFIKPFSFSLWICESFIHQLSIALWCSFIVISYMLMIWWLYIIVSIYLLSDVIISLCTYSQLLVAKDYHDYYYMNIPCKPLLCILYGAFSNTCLDLILDLYWFIFCYHQRTQTKDFEMTVSFGCYVC